MMKIIANIICYSMADVSDCKETSQEALSMSLDKTDGKFALKLYQDSNSVASKIQIHSSSYNVTCFRYKAVITRKYWFGFPCPCIAETKVTDLGLIKMSRNNP